MHKLERLDRVLAGKSVDRPPVSLWYHFGVQHGPGEQFARIALDFFDHYDFDFLKVMNDYFFPLPDGLDALHTRADLEKIQPVDIENCDWRHQFSALEIIVSRSSPGFLKQHVKEGIKLGGARRFILAGGCSIPSWTYPGSIRAIVDTAKAVAST